MEINGIKPGNIILYDDIKHREPPYCMVRGNVKEIKGNVIVFDDEETRNIEQCTGLPVYKKWFEKYNLNESDYPGIKFVHELQNLATQWVD